MGLMAHYTRIHRDEKLAPKFGSIPPKFVSGQNTRFYHFLSPSQLKWACLHERTLYRWDKTMSSAYDLSLEVDLILWPLTQKRQKPQPLNAKCVNAGLHARYLPNAPSVELICCRPIYAFMCLCKIYFGVHKVFELKQSSSSVKHR